MNGTNIVFDTCAVINLIDRHSSLVIDDAQFFTSVIVRMELLSKRIMSDEDEQDIREFLDDVIIVPLNEEIEEKAIELRRNTTLKLPDSIVAATAIVLDAILLTDDTHLLNLSWPGLRTLKII